MEIAKQDTNQGSMLKQQYDLYKRYRKLKYKLRHCVYNKTPNGYFIYKDGNKLGKHKKELYFMDILLRYRLKMKVNSTYSIGLTSPTSLLSNLKNNYNIPDNLGVK